MKISILGSGCKKCLKLEENARNALKELGLEDDADVEKITDVKDIMNYGVMMTPALAVDDKVVSSGKVLSVEEIKKLIS